MKQGFFFFFRDLDTLRILVGTPEWLYAEMKGKPDIGPDIV